MSTNYYCSCMHLKYKIVQRNKPQSFGLIPMSAQWLIIIVFFFLKSKSIVRYFTGLKT